MSENNVLLSIVIPTRNREYYCIEAIKNILNNEDYFELVVQDNSDSNQVQDFVSTLEDNRLAYNRTVGRINSVTNMDKAISMATGKYVIMIGDDDTILPNIFSLVRWANENDFSAVSPLYQIRYFWPNAVSDREGYLTYDSYNSQYSFYRGKTQLRKLLKNGIINYGAYHLPKVYHGLVQRSILNKINQITGHYIGGLSPDMYLAVSCAILCDKYVEINYPISIAGACNSSSTAENLRGEHRGDLAKAPHLFNNLNYMWDNMIPAVYSVESIWAETALKALEEMGMSKMKNDFNTGYFLAALIGNNDSITSKIIEKTKSIKKNSSNGKIFFFFLFLGTKKIIVRLYRKIKLNKTKKINGIPDIASAVISSRNILSNLTI